MACIVIEEFKSLFSSFLLFFYYNSRCEFISSVVRLKCSWLCIVFQGMVDDVKGLFAPSLNLPVSRIYVVKSLVGRRH